MRQLRQQYEWENYWRNIERELGERVLAKTMARCIEGCGELPAPWGLCFITDRTLQYRYRPMKRSLGGLFDKMLQRQEPKEECIAIPLEYIVMVEPTPKPGWLRRIVTLVLPTYRIVWQIDGEHANLTLELGPGSNEIEALLLEQARGLLRQSWRNPINADAHTGD